MNLADATSPEAAGAGLVLVPVGSIEQHGPHLPLDADTAIAVAVADAVGAELPGAWVAPPIAYGASGEHQSFAGTCSVGTEALRHQLIELVRSIRTWSTKVCFINAHGGNLTALRGAVEQLRSEGHDVTWVPCATEDVDLHAGRTETSLMLHLRPESVRLVLAEKGDTRPLSEVLPLLMRGGVDAVSANGVLGDPTGATAEEGQRVLAAMVRDVQSRLGSEAQVPA